MNGRMMQPDNYVQDATNTQSFNRYSYCWNNPLKYTDPSGEFVVPWLAIGVGLAATYFSGVAYSSGEWNPTKWKTQTWLYAGATGLVAGGITYGITQNVGYNKYAPFSNDKRVDWAYIDINLKSMPVNGIPSPNNGSEMASLDGMMTNVVTSVT
jgi:hypothetical protein